MKKIYAYVCLLWSFCSVAQVVNIPDTTFKKVLISFGADENNDGKIQVEEASSIRNLNLSNRGIRSMKGIEAFTGLITLHCEENDIDSLDLSNSTHLIQLNAAGSSLRYLNVTKCTELKKLSVYGFMTDLNISKNTKLTELAFTGTGLQTLDVSSLSSLVTLSLWYAPLKTLDLSHNKLLEAVTVNSSQIDHLDLSQNLTLKTLTCIYNKLTSLTVASPHLAIVNATDNQLASFSATSDSIRELSLSNNQLTGIDVSNYSLLYSLECSTNRLKSLDVSHNPLLWNLNCAGNIRLHYICIVEGASSGSFTKDFSAEWTTDCSLILTLPKEVSFKEANIYPNPSSNGVFSIESSLFSSPFHLSVVDLYGQEVSFASTISSGKVLLDIGHQTHGQYLLLLSNGAETTRKKIVF